MCPSPCVSNYMVFQCNPNKNQKQLPDLPLTAPLFDLIFQLSILPHLQPSLPMCQQRCPQQLIQLPLAVEAIHVVHLLLSAEMAKETVMLTLTAWVILCA